MKSSFIQFKPQSSQPTRALYLDLINEKKIIIKDINILTKHLQMILTGDYVIHYSQKPMPISRANVKAIKERIEELKNPVVKFKTTQLAKSYTDNEILLSIEGLAIQLINAGVHLIKRGLIIIKDLCTLHYSVNGQITKTEPDLGLIGVNALEVIAGICAQDFGLVVERDHNLIYLYGSARYEKTPKHVETGFDYFVGENFLEWHRRIPQWGPILVTLFENMYLAFKQQQLDSLIVDLKGRNLYTDGKIVLRRYERDYVLPLSTTDGTTIGIIVFADSLFKDINDENRPFFGGKHLSIKSPKEFNNNFRIITHPAFQHHPFGIRDKNGTLPLAPNIKQ